MAQLFSLEIIKEAGITYGSFGGATAGVNILTEIYNKSFVGKNLAFAAVSDLSAVTFTITYIDEYGDTATEDVTGPNAAAVESLVAGNFQLLSITTDIDVAAPFSISTGTLAQTNWVMVNTFTPFFSVTHLFNPNSVTYSLEILISKEFTDASIQALPCVLTNASTIPPAIAQTIITNLTSQYVGWTEVPVRGFRLLLENIGIGEGIKWDMIQQGPLNS